MLIRCTRKLLKASGLEPEDTDDEPAELFGEWYATTVSLPFPGRMAVMYTSARTLLTVVAPGRVLRTTLPVFRVRLSALLHRLALPAEWIARQTGALGEVRVAKTRNRHVVGSMNDLAYMLQAYTEDVSKFARVDWDRVENRLAENPLSYMNHEAAAWRIPRIARGDTA